LDGDTQQAVLNPKSGQTYSASAWVKTQSGTGTASLTLRAWSGGAYVGGVRTAPQSIDATWRQITVTYSLTADVAELDVALFGDSGTCLLADDLMLVPASGPSPACTSFTYSDWGPCQSNNTQTRTLVSSLPAGCTGGTPVLTQPCNAAAPPTIDPGTMTSSSPITVTISCPTAETSPYRTTDGSTPTTSSTRSDTATFASSGTLRAICAGAGYSPSAEASATYTITTATTGSWVTSGGAPCTNGGSPVPDPAACEWKPCKDEPLPSTVYYVCNTGGDDSRTTTQARSPATPWATVSRAVQQFGNLNPGEAIAFCRGGTFTGGGTWTNNNGTQASPTIVRDYTRPGREGSGDPRPIFQHHLDSYITPGRVRFMNISAQASAGDVNVAFTYGAVADITFCNLELSGGVNGLEIAGSDLTSMQRIKVIGTRFLSNTSEGWIGSGQAHEIRNSFFSKCGTLGGTLSHSIYLAGPRVAQQDYVISENEFHPPANVPGAVVVAHGIHNNMLFENNRLIFDNGPAQASGWGIAVGCGGYSTPSNATNLTARGNTIVNAGNVSLGIACCQHCLIENNLVINTQQSTRAIAAPLENASSFGAGYTATSDVIVRNNTVYLTAGGSGVDVASEGGGYAVENNAVQSNGPCYRWSGSAGAFTARDYNASYGCSESVVGSHSFTLNPLWLNPTSATSRDFHPGTGSPLIHTGDPAQKPAIDITGTTRSSPPSVGAYEP
jgi:hypothetical protein